jgi:ATP-binding cassette subfamily F protein 3
MLKDFPGSVLFVSHDRYFVKQIADSLLVFEDDTVTYLPYGYEEYVERKNNTYAASVDRGIYAAKEAAARAAKQAAVVEEAPVQKGKESYEQGKERSRLEKKLKKLEEKISKLETAIEEKKEELLSPEYATAYTKLEQIQAEIEENEMELLEVMEEWDEVGQKLEEL